MTTTRAVRRRARRYAVANQKGGTGKTTTAVQLAAALAGLGWRVLVGDLDPQCNATTTTGAVPGEYTLAEVLRPDPVTREVVAGSAGAAIVPAGPAWPGSLHVLPAALSLVDREDERPAGGEFRLLRSCEGVTEHYDFVLWDLPPSLGALAVNGLVAADEVLLVTEATRYGLEGTAQALSTIDRVRSYYNPGLSVAGILVNKYRGHTTEGRLRLEELRSSPLYRGLVCGVLAHIEVVAKAAGAAHPVAAYGAEGARAADWYRGFARMHVLGEDVPAGVRALVAGDVKAVSA